jgi:nitroreductase
MALEQKAERDATWAAVAEAIRGRRSNLNVDHEREVPREVVEELAGLAVQAPNHYRTNPWRFVVLTGQARARLGDVVAGILAGRPDAKEAAVERQRAQFLRAPTVLVVASAGDADPIRHFENKHAVAAGIENLLVGATAMGIASAWKSGPAMTDPEVGAAVKETLGLAPEDEIVGVVYLGYPTGAPGAVTRPTPHVAYISE